ncbi:MAG: universal stress protein, partial [Cypionkella sp.]
MGYKSLLTILTNPAEAAMAIGAAARLARQGDAHLDILALGVDRSQVGYSYLGAGAAMIQLGIERSEKEARAVEVAARAEVG